MHINKTIDLSFKNGVDLIDIKGTDYSWYKQRNSYMINHFDNVVYPNNVHLLRSQNIFCDEKDCYSVKDKLPLYFDHGHPAIPHGASKLANLINISRIELIHD